MNVRLTQGQKIQILNSEDVWKIMQQVLLRENKIRRNQEHFWVVGLNNKNKILFIELVSLGSNNMAAVAAPEVFRMGIYKLAVKMILVHNHPSGETEPSDGDKDFTDKMMKAGQIINIEVIDHLVISDEKYYSFQDHLIMDDLRKSGLYELVEREKAEMKAVREKALKEAAEFKKAEEIAKKMKAKGYDEDLIKELTGLSKSDIKEL